MRFLEACTATISSESAKTADAQPRAQELSSLTKTILTWPKLSGEFRTVIGTLTRSVQK